MYLIDEVLYKKKISEKTLNIDQNQPQQNPPQEFFLMNDISKENTDMNSISNDKVLDTNANKQITSDNSLYDDKKQVRNLCVYSRPSDRVWLAICSVVSGRSLVSPYWLS